MPRRTKSKPRSPVAPKPATYWELTQQPLQALIFLLPLIVLYEIGTMLYVHDNVDITARTMLRSFFLWFGVAGYYLPGLVVIVVLIAWHVARKDRFRVEPLLYLKMAGEAIAWAIPLLVLMTMLGRPRAAAATTTVASIPWQTGLVFSFGAAIYEELLFRLIAIALLHLILVDVLALSENVGAGAAIAASAIAFGLHHFTGDTPFVWSQFLQYTLAGVFLAGIYLFRGFGIVVGTHAFYDVIAVILRAMTG